jgi:predicted nuclease with TOPRIM domain
MLNRFNFALENTKMSEDSESGFFFPNRVVKNEYEKMTLKLIERMDRFEAELREAKAQICQTQNELNATRAELAQRNAEIQTLRNDIDHLRNEEFSENDADLNNLSMAINIDIENEADVNKLPMATYSDNEDQLEGIFYFSLTSLPFKFQS